MACRCGTKVLKTPSGNLYCPHCDRHCALALPTCKLCIQYIRVVR